MAEKRGFKGIWIPREIWLHPDLTMQEKIMLVEIDSLDNDRGCWAQNKHFAEFLNIGERRVQTIIKSLKEKGYITIGFTYKPGTKEIERRVIRVSANYPRALVERGEENDTTPGEENDTTPPEQNVAGVVKESSQGGEGKFAENNTVPIKALSINTKESKGTAAAEAADPTPDFSQTNFSLEMIARVWEWIKYKKERRFTYKPIGLNALITEIQNNVTKYGEQAVMELINYCMANGYQGIIFDRLNSQSPANRPPQAPQGMPDTFNEFAQRRQRYEGGGNR